MEFSGALLDEILADREKYISDDISWRANSAWWDFSVDVLSPESYPLRLKGSVSRHLPRVELTLLYGPVGRVYSLGIGRRHRNPDGNFTENVHKHVWTEAHGAGWAYHPTDITARPPEYSGIWRQFCAEARIRHDGRFYDPPLRQAEISWP